MKKKEKQSQYNYQFKHTAVTITNHPDIQTVDVAEALSIHPIMLYRWRGEMRTGKTKDNDQKARSTSELIAPVSTPVFPKLRPDPSLPTLPQITSTLPVKRCHWKSYMRSCD